MLRDQLKEHIDPWKIFLDIVEEKFDSAGIRLSKKDRESFKKHLEENRVNQFVPENASAEMWKGLTIEIGDDDLKKVSEKQNLIVEKFPEITRDILENSSKDILKSLLKDWKKRREYEYNKFFQFQEKVFDIWGEALDELFMLITMAIEMGRVAHKKNSRRKKQKLVNGVLIRLHARACQVALESFFLMLKGFADGAMARWRTLHEISVISSFLAKHGEDLAEKYLAHEHIESYKAALQYQKYSKFYSRKETSKKVLDRLKETCSSLEKKYGESFCNEYGWASTTLKNKRPTFSTIEESLHLDHVRPYYKMASYNVHANSKGILFRLGLLNADKILTGPSDLGLADPGQNIAFSISFITTNLFSLDQTMDMVTYSKVMQIFSRQVEQKFSIVHRRIEKAAKKRMKSSESK